MSAKGNERCIKFVWRKMAKNLAQRSRKWHKKIKLAKLVAKEKKILAQTLSSANKSANNLDPDQALGLFDTLMVFLKVFFFLKVNFEKYQQTTKRQAKLASMQRVKNKNFYHTLSNCVAHLTVVSSGLDNRVLSRSAIAPRSIPILCVVPSSVWT